MNDDIGDAVLEAMRDPEKVGEAMESDNFCSAISVSWSRGASGRMGSPAVRIGHFVQMIADLDPDCPDSFRQFGEAIYAGVERAMQTIKEREQLRRDRSA